MIIIPLLSISMKQFHGKTSMQSKINFIHFRKKDIVLSEI